MSWGSHAQPSAQPTRKDGVWEEQKSPGTTPGSAQGTIWNAVNRTQVSHMKGFQKRGTEVYVGNLPVDISEVEILYLLKDFSPLHVHKIQNGCKCFAFVDLGSVQNVALAVQKLNGTFFHQRKLYLNSSKNVFKRTQDVAGGTRELLEGPSVTSQVPALGAEETSGEVAARSLACALPTARAGDLHTVEKPGTPIFAVPMEMRGSFLALLLRECFRDLSWLATICSASGEVGLLVTSVVPQTPFFWAMRITEALHKNMQTLFSSLAEAEERQPYLRDEAVQRGARGLAELQLGDRGCAWNRCWVLERVGAWAVIMFIDFGQTATVPVGSLRSLESDAFWTVPPLTQPFALEQGVLGSHQTSHCILRGKVTGTLELEPHILKFEEFK